MRVPLRLARVVRRSFCAVAQNAARPCLAVAQACATSLRLALREKGWRRPVFFVSVRAEGIEPSAFPLSEGCSTTELSARVKNIAKQSQICYLLEWAARSCSTRECKMHRTVPSKKSNGGSTSSAPKSGKRREKSKALRAQDAAALDRLIKQRNERKLFRTTK